MSFFEIILILVLATVIHEIGHLLGAKIVGIRIKEAALGFGPILYEFKFQTIKIKVCWILLGGYVMPEGTNEEFLSFPKRHRIILTASGLIMSIFVLPIFALILINLIESKSLNVIPNFITILQVFLNHPFEYFYSGLTIFPTITYTNDISSYLSCLAEISLFLGIVNALPIPILDGGQILLTILENKIPRLRDNYALINIIGYIILLTIILFPMFEVFFHNIKTMFPIILFILFILYRVLKINYSLFKKQ